MKAGAGVLVVLSILLWFVGEKALSVPSGDLRSAEAFSPAHASVGQAMKHFFGVRSVAAQPIAFVHKAHVETVQLQCTDCHISATRGPQAGLPDIRTCWSCHVNTLTDRPEIKKILAYHDRGEDIPWQRVYGWTDEAHVRFNHAPHLRAKVECSTCHGNVAGMAVAERAVDHTMGFCINCHKQREVSNDCGTCHF